MPEIVWDDDENTPGFNSEEFDVGESEAQAGGEAEELVQNLTAPGPDPEPAVDFMGDIDRRLKIASLFRVVLDGNLFEGQEDEDTALVQSEINEFVRSRLRALVGIGGGAGPAFAPVKPQFSDAEAAAIKAAAELAQSGALQALARLGQREVVALQILAQAAMKQRGLVPEQKKPEAKPAPIAAPPKLAPRKVPPPAAKSTAPVAAKPVALKPVARPGTKPAAGKTKDLKKKVVSRIGEMDPATGKPYETEVQRIQRPAGMVPFPSDNRALEVATAQQAQQSVSVRSNVEEINTGINPT